MSGETCAESVLIALQCAGNDGLSLQEIADLTGYIATSCSAALRQLRTPNGGNHTIEGMRQARGCWRYRMEILK